MPFDDTTGYLKQQEQTADPFSLESLTRWLEEQCAAGRADEGYCYTDGGRCLLAQYCKEVGIKYTSSGLPPRSVRPTWTHWFSGWEIELGTEAQLLELAAAYAGGPRTFGAALSRARALLASRKSAS